MTSSSGRAVQQDSIIDDEDLTCPLCIEELDVYDRHFKPCPCGYQICQFCYNNISQNHNALCPACRRPYDEKTIEYKKPAPEEVAEYNANLRRDKEKKADQRQKEAQKREVETLNRKHLAGLRVVQKNLVYVLGLSPGIPDQDFLQTLRRDDYFGQYGKVLKIMVTKTKGGQTSQNGSQSGVYVTFERPEDAARCIAAVHNSQNGDRILRAQLGTTKYCSAYLRNETCTNKTCMFLHEPGDSADSYSRQDLSSINSGSTQRPLPGTFSSSSSVRQIGRVQATTQQPAAAASQPMARDLSKDGSDSGDGSALPSSASWANRGQQLSRRGSVATSGATSSPAISTALPVAFEEQQNESNEDATKQTDTVSPTPVTTGVSRRTTNPALSLLIRSIGNLAVRMESGFQLSADELASRSNFPPLFDDCGGLKRRALKEQQEEARQHLEQDVRDDFLPAMETQDEEEPESGSLQLGGEPEDREDSRESGHQTQSFHDQRRQSSQLPIQRATESSMFGLGGGRGFSQNVGNLSSINGQNLTPIQQQQLLLLKSGQSQSSFMDQFPSGMSGGAGSSQSTLLPQQSDSRQSSRYNFAGDSASSASLSKQGVGLKSSMMSPQQANSFYGSTMPGPPPGLKSTGTPPINTGGMFGQSQGFASAAFGTGVKDNNSDMIRELMRTRGTAGPGQSHDVGKRESMFPSFLHQYPPTSTPAPASGLLASLYGPQPGAFHDFGPKQKKKGKKHRHANTSSSGGGGLVDLADPTILQTRMPHQQQSNAGVGQGLFGGQAQDEQGLPSLDEASISVDALVAESVSDGNNVPVSLGVGFVSRPSTPAVPPGLSLSHAHPSPAVRDLPAVNFQRRIVPTSAPFTPSRNVGLVYSSHNANQLANLAAPQAPIQTAAPTIASDSVKTQPKSEVQQLTSKNGLLNIVGVQSVQRMSAASLQSDEFPVLEPVKAKENTALESSRSTIEQPRKLPLNPTAATSNNMSGSKATMRRQALGTLNIALPVQPNTKDAESSDPPVKGEDIATSFPPLPVSTLASANAPPSAGKVLPKASRVVPTPKAESPSIASSTPLSSTSTIPPTFPQTRQPSLPSLPRLERPTTPVSETISDNASVTSASVSRPGSPPLARVGSAPVRSTTKSQQKRQRRDAQKEKSELGAVVDTPEPEIAPIIGRKKKQKKEKISSGTGVQTPIPSRPQSPKPNDDVEEELPAKSEIIKQSTPVPSVEVEPESSSKIAELKGKEKSKVEDLTQVEVQTPLSGDVVDESFDKPTPTPSSVFQDLITSGYISDPINLPFLKAPAASNPRLEYTDLQEMESKLVITEEDRASLLAGRPVYKVSHSSSRMMLTPNGECIRNLTPAEEERYLELQQKIFEEVGPAAFRSARHNAGNGFTLIGGRAVPNGPPAFFPPAEKNGTAPVLDPVSKIQRDEALSYINQFVLPSLSANSQLERALNANALEADMMRPNGSNWSRWTPEAVQGGRSPSTTETPYGASSNNDGILATGLESMTAHFTVDRDSVRNQPMGNVKLLSLSESESALQSAKKETEKLEKSLNQLLKKNRRLLLARVIDNSHGRWQLGSSGW